MMKRRLLALLLFAAPALTLAQTIAPKDIKPGANGQSMQTVGGQTVWAAPATGGVGSVFGRTGAVAAQTGDYACGQITGAVCALPPLNYQTLFSNSTPMTQRPALNLIPGVLGAVNCVDNPITLSTDCTVNGSGAAPGIVAVNDVTGSRSFGSTYRNANPFAIEVSASGSLFLGVSHQATIQGRLGPSYPSIVGPTSSITNSSGATAVGFIVPAGYFYGVYTSIGIPGETDPANVYRWLETTLPYGGISASVPFTINSFTGGGVVELGAAVVNPSFAATYSTTPASAQISNTDGTDSPHNLTTPFTGATLSGTFTHSAIATTTFTLTAIQGTTQTATQTIGWQPRIFSGVGSAGATSSVTASGTTAVLSTSDVLASAGLGAETVGQTFGPFSPSGQVVYLLLTGGSHTFTDAGTGFPFAFNAPISVSFVNAHGVTVSMFLYASTNPLTGTFTPRVAS